MKNTKPLNLREIVVIASISAVFGVLYLLWVFFGQLIQGIFGPVGHGLISGFWIMAPIVCAYIIRKPGVALIAELVAAGTEILAGSVNAGAVLILGLTQGFGAELALALFLYRSYRLPVLMLAGMFGTLANFITIYFMYGYSQYSSIITTFMLVAMLVSGAILAGWGSKSIADALGRTGVLDNFALGKINRQKRVKKDDLPHH
ncbi:ECF transporter S component [Cytobacillus purgationiresistens]|uniref:Energy-coupling factor transport system substrate-specific component n=1 Tax=Cytobacillus purgationiresistens TaxID=863449 RepID=A0ABU0ADL8_9BACI|nr:ECF transporter S component [Cytobacillus purgationiresistens]MDQ0269339.1 energy-coupling factor transport system substrate-specific component [Cytobacillus purgationiresistens]